MIGYEIRPITMEGFRPPTKIDEAISETLKMCGVYGEDASMIHMEVIRKIGVDVPLPCCSAGIPTQEEEDAQPERLTNKDFEVIRLHLNAQKERLCNQRLWEWAEEYQCIIDKIDKLMPFAPSGK